MISPTTLRYFILAFIVLEYALARVLDYLNTKNWSPEIPEEMKGHIDEKKYEQARQYDLAHKRFGLLTGTFSTLLIIAMLITGGFGMLDTWARQFTDSPILLALI